MFAEDRPASARMVLIIPPHEITGLDLPTAILLQRDRLGDPTARRHLRGAVEAVLASGPSPVTAER